MKYAVSILPLALNLAGSVQALPQAAAPQCSHNNCLRAVIAGSFPERPTRADCSSFLRKTVTPAAYTQTIWETVTPVTETATSYSTEVVTDVESITVTQTIDAATQTLTATVTRDPVIISRRDNGIDQQAKRQVTIQPSAMPTYATACRSVQAYSSACSCIGITETTVTEAVPTVKVTSTSTVTAQTTIGLVETDTTTVSVTVTDTESRTLTATATETVVATPPWENFVVRASGGSVNGGYVYTWQRDPSSVSFLQSFTSRAGSTRYYMSSPNSGALMRESNARYGVLDVSRGVPGPFGATWMANADMRMRDSLDTLGCSISADTWELKCALNSDQSQNSWYACPVSGQYVVQIGPPSYPAPSSWQCQSIKLYAERA